MKTAALILVSILFALILCEGALRIFNRVSPRTASAPPVTTNPDKADIAAAARYIAAMPAAPGTDRAWFTEDPPPLPNRSTPSAAQLARSQEFERLGLKLTEADYLWNRKFVESALCDPRGIFQKFPGDIPVFDPPSGSLYPRYRFPPNITTRSGLVTNQFGLRGPPVELVKPPKTIRIAFLGASTTINHPNYPFSYPERVVYWLNRYAQANHFDVRFEVLNSGREGLTSQDIAAIVRDELVPLDPDLAVYYEGANEFLWVLDLISPHIPARTQLDPQEATMIHNVPEFIRSHLLLGDLLDRAMTGFGTLGEPPKPAYQLNWPGKVNESDPGVDGPNLPAAMVTILKDLDSIRAGMSSIGGQFALCSFEWMVQDGMRLTPRHRYIYEHVNTILWPLRYRDIRRLADFQNRVFRRYASDRNVPFLDIAAQMPMDPQLYVDAIHMTDAGERTKAWIAFQQLVPLLRPQVENGTLPRTHEHLPPPPSLSSAMMRNQCEGVPSGRLYPVQSAVSLDNIDAMGAAAVTSAPPFVLTTTSQQWTHAASLPLSAPPGLPRPVYLLIRGRVLSGQVGYVVEDANGETQVHKAVGPTAAAADIYVPVPSPDTAKSFFIQNDAEHAPSRLEIDRVSLLASSPTPPEELIRKIDLKQGRAESGTVEAEADKLRVTTREAQYGYAARVSLGLGRDSEAGLRVHVWLRTIEGKTGVGIVNDTGQAFLITRTVRPSPRTVEIVLPLPSPPVIGDLIVRNDAAGNVSSQALIEKIEIRKAP